MHLIMINQVIAQYQSEPVTPKESAQKSVKGHENKYSDTQTKNISYRPASQCILHYHTRIAFQSTIALCSMEDKIWVCHVSLMSCVIVAICHCDDAKMESVQCGAGGPQEACGIKRIVKEHVSGQE